MTYTVFDAGKKRKGEAKKVLESIRAQGAAHNEEIRKMNVSAYADALIEDAPYFISDALLKALEDEKFDSKYDRALMYLSAMPTSGIMILSTR